jgi:steroid delta-isomerase-like uncharacterized protein
MSTEEHKAVAKQYQAAWARGDLATLATLLADDCTSIKPDTGERRGTDHELNACELWHAAFDDVATEIRHVVAEGDLVTVHWLLTSTHTAEFMGIAATGNKVTIPGMEVNRVEGGKITEIWRLSDNMAVMQQLGAL